MSSNVWYHTFDDQFWILVAGLVIGFLSVIAKSKCERCGLCCGCLEIERNVQAELQAERMENAHMRARRGYTRQNSIDLGFHDLEMGARTPDLNLGIRKNQMNDV